MSEYIYVVPLEGLSVKHPDTFAWIPEEGQRVRKDAYWQKMKDQGIIDIKEVEDEKPAKSKEVKK